MSRIRRTSLSNSTKSSHEKNPYAFLFSNTYRQDRIEVLIGSQNRRDVVIEVCEFFFCGQHDFHFHYLKSVYHENI